MIKQTAKFRTRYHESSISYKNTLPTDHSIKRIKNHNNSLMNVQQLDLPKDDTIIVDGTHQIKSQKQVYNCLICQRLRAVCPSNQYHSPQFYCKIRQQRNKKISNFINLQSTKGNSYSNNNKKDKIFNNLLKDINYKQTKNDRERKMNTLQSDYFKIQNRNYKPPQIVHPCNYQTQYSSKPRSISTQPTITEEIIFYPVIHNSFVYVNYPSPNPQKRKYDSVQKKKYDSSQRRQKFMNRDQEKEIQDQHQKINQLNSSDKILTPNEYRNLADSLRRQLNPNIQSNY